MTALKPWRAVSLAITLLAIVVLGLVIGSGRLARKPPATPSPLFDFNSPDASTVLNTVFADWFTNPARRESALGLLTDPVAGPFGGRRPALSRVVINSRTVPGSYRPAVAGVVLAVSNPQGRPALVVGELSIDVERFEVLTDGSVRVVFYQGNHGYEVKRVTYLARKGTTGWLAELEGEE